MSGEPRALSQQNSGDHVAQSDPQAARTTEGAPPPPLRVRIALDLLERVFVVVLFAWLAWSVIAVVGLGASWVNLMQLGAEGLNVVFILLRRRAVATSYRVADWAVSLGVVTFSLAARPGTLPPLASPVLALVLFVCGIGLQAWAKLTLRRSFGIIPANRGVVVAGPYRLVRHPMYLGYLLGWCGFYLLNPTLWNTNVYALCILLQWLRLESEERVLSGDPAFEAYRAAVRYRVIPWLF